MKIVNTKFGQAYHLKPGTQLEVERTNLFFNKWGEQTTPVELPDTDLNRQLTGFPDVGVNKIKTASDIVCTIEDNDYFMECRQAILRAKRNEGISTAFYMNEGSFLSRVDNISLKEMFGDEIIPGINTVTEGIAFCKSLMNGTNENYAFFPVIINFEGERRYLNRIEWMDGNGSYHFLGRPSGRIPENYKLGLYNEFDRVEKSGDSQVSLTPGFYLTPFIRARYLLRRIFQYFGYTLATNFFDVTEPFKNMVFVNTTMDALVNGTILLAHIVPDCMCGTILEVFRKKFNCEFISDEVNRVVTVKFFNEIIKKQTEVDLSTCLTEPFDIDYSNEWKRINLSSESVIDDGPTFNSIVDVIKKYPEAYCNERDGAYYHIGYTVRAVKEKIAGSTMPYSAGGLLKEEKITIPDCAISMQYEPEDDSGLVVEGVNSTYSRFRSYTLMPYVGDANALNSIVNFNNINMDDAEVEITSDSHKQSPMLCFVYNTNLGFAYGTTTNCNTSGTKIFDYSLHYYGENGIFEKFYREMDTLYRNSLIPVMAKLLLDNVQKQHLAAHEKIIINGQEFLINKLKFTLGGHNEPIDSDLLTVQLYEPITVAPLEVERFVSPLYAWTIKLDRRQITIDEYNSIKIKNSTLPILYLPPPTEEQYKAGGKYYPRIYYQSTPSGKYYIENTVYLVPILNS